MLEKKNSSCIDCGMQEEAPLLPSTIAIPPQASLYRLQRFSPTTTTNTDVSPESMMDGFTDSAAAACTPLKMDRHGSHRGPSPDPMEEVSCVSAPRAGSRSAVDVVDAADPLARAAQWSSRRPASAAEFGREAPKSSGGSDGSRHHHHHHQHHQRTSGRGTARPLHGQNPDDVEEGRDASARLCNTVQLTPSPREEVPKRSLTPPHDSLRLIHDRLRSQRTPDRHASSSSSHAVDTRRSIPKAQRSPDTRRSPPNAAQRSPNPRRSPLKAATYANASTVIAALHTPSPKVRGGRIKVVVRKRPMNMDEGGEDCVRVASPALSLSITKHRVDLSEYTERNDFSFDDSFDESTHNEAIFASCGRELLDVAMQGGSASFFAYGQTGSGKTYTMMGTNEDKGLYLLSAEAVFEQLSRSQQVSVAFYEIYCNSLFDLLNNRTPVILREGSDRRVNVCGLTWHNIGSATELWRLIETGQDQRRTGSTSANERSSRSHAVMSLQIRDEDAEDCCGMFNFVDLAGSERAADTANNDKQTRLEGAEINKSLLALKECIRALDEKKRHVPFRGSRLTEVLRDSFMGNSKTVMVANISPSSSNYDHTVNTLRYAFRVKGLSIESVGPSKARNAPRPMPTSLRSRSAPNLPDLRAADQENSASGCTPLALRSPNTSAKTDSGIPQHHHYQQRGRSGRPGNRQTESSSNSNNNNNNNFSPSTPQVTPNKYDSTECSTAGRGDVDGDGDGSRRQRSNIRRRFLQPLSEADGTSAKSASANTMRRPPSAELRAMEERLQAKIMKQLQLDLGNEIQNILDGRDALIAALRKENAELKSQLACCQCGSPSMFPDENFSPGAPPPTLKPSDLQKRVSFDHDL